MHLGRSVPPSHPLAFPCFRSVTPFPLVLLQVEQTQCKVQEMVALAQVEQRRHRVSLGSEEMVATGGRVAQVMLDHTRIVQVGRRHGAAEVLWGIQEMVRAVPSPPVCLEGSVNTANLKLLPGTCVPTHINTLMCTSPPHPLLSAGLLCSPVIFGSHSK